jgi:NADPH:quinone reductase-like Zn-dependent oxidoreductase
MAIIGNLGGGEEPLPVLGMIEKNIRLQGVSVGSREMYTRMIQMMSEHKIVPVIDRIYPFDNAIEAFEGMSLANHFGKIVLTF